MFIKGRPCSCVNFPSSLFRYVFSESMTAMCGFFCISGVYPSAVSMVTLVIVYAYQSTSSTFQSFHPFPNFHDTQHRLGASLVVAVLNVSHSDIIILPTPLPLSPLLHQTLLHIDPLFCQTLIHFHLTAIAFP